MSYTFLCDKLYFLLLITLVISILAITSINSIVNCFCILMKQTSVSNTNSEKV